MAQFQRRRATDVTQRVHTVTKLRKMSAFTTTSTVRSINLQKRTPKVAQIHKQTNQHQGATFTDIGRNRNKLGDTILYHKRREASKPQNIPLQVKLTRTFQSAHTEKIKFLEENKYGQDTNITISLLEDPTTYEQENWEPFSIRTETKKPQRVALQATGTVEGQEKSYGNASEFSRLKNKLQINMKSSVENTPKFTKNIRTVLSRFIR